MLHLIITILFRVGLLFQDPGPGPVLDLPALLAQFITLVGFGALVAALINAGKFIGWIKEGMAPNVSLVLNAVGFVVLIVLRLFRPDFDVQAADAAIGTFAQILVLSLGLFLQLTTSKAVHAGLTGLPVIGYSFSAHRAATFDAEVERSQPSG